METRCDLGNGIGDAVASKGCCLGQGSVQARVKLTKERKHHSPHTGRLDIAQQPEQRHKACSKEKEPRVFGDVR